MRNQKNGNARLLLNGVIVAIVAIAIFIGTRPSAVTVGGDALKVSGMYGVTVKLNDIQEIKLWDTLPKIERRLNGMDFFGMQKGIYRLEEWGKARLFTYTSEGPFLFIQTEEEIIVINDKNAEETRKVYEELRRNLQ